MNNKAVYLDDSGKLLLSSAYLKKQGIQPKTIEMWATRDKNRFGSYFYYEGIPTPSKLKLPQKDELTALCRSLLQGEAVNIYLKKMTWCSEKGFIKHIAFYKDKYNVNEAKAINAARLHSVWEYIMELKNEGCKDAKGFYAAFNKVFPNKYTSLPSFCNKMGVAVKLGVEAVSKKDSWFTAPKNSPKTSELNKYLIAGVVSSGKKFTAPEILEKIKVVCEAKNVKCPCRRTVQYLIAEFKENPIIFNKRYGGEVANQLPTASLIQAQHVHSQWQADAYTTPIFTTFIQPNGQPKTIRLKLSLVKDAHSHKILGYSLDRSEDAKSIMAAYTNAIYATKDLQTNMYSVPNEIATDNHSAHQTEIFTNFTDGFKRIGTTITIDSNPRRKIVMERDNKYLTALFKNSSNSVNEGMKAIGMDARTKPELVTYYYTHPYTLEQSESIVFQVVKDFNNTVLKKRGKTPNQLYAESQTPHCFKIDLMGFMQLVIPRKEMKIKKGQITIERGFTKHEFALNSSQYSLYNNDTVIVRFFNLEEGICIYEKATDKKIGFIKPKPRMHAALADQTPDDIKRYHQHTGKLEGIKADAKKQLVELSKNAHEIDPNAYGYLSAMLTDKSTLAAIEESANMNKYGTAKQKELQTVNIETDDDEDDFLKPTEKKSKGAYSPKKPVKFGYYVPPIED